MAPKMGMNAKLYRQTGTSWAVPTFTEISTIQNINLGLEKTKVDGSTRASRWKWSKGALKDATLEITLPKDDGDAFYRALLRSLLRNTAVELLVMDGIITTAGSEGLRAEWECFGAPRTEEIEGIQMVTFSLSITYSSNKPQWYVCATKSTDSGSAIVDGTDVYWDATEEEVTTTASTNEYLGESVGASLDATAYMYYDADHDTP